MSTELSIGVLSGNKAPVTLAEAVYIGDGTNTTVKEAIKNLQKNSGTSTGTELNYILGGTVKIFIDIINKKVSWQQGTLYTSTEKISLSAGSLLFTSSDCNTGNPNYAYLLCYNNSTLEWKTIDSNLSSYTGNPILLFHYNSLNVNAPTNDDRATIHLLYYKPENICSNARIVGMKSPVFKKMAILGDSLSSGSNWSKFLDLYTYIPTINCAAKSGATMANQSTGTLNIATGQVSTVESDTDCTIIFAGTNDGMFGSSVDSFVESPTQNNTSFTESYQYTIETLLTLNPKMKIYLVTPMFTLGKTYGDKSITYDSNKSMRDAVISIGQHYNLPVLDLFYECGVNKFNSTTYQTDGVHGTEIGYRNICDKIWKFICSK